MPSFRSSFAAPLGAFVFGVLIALLLNWPMRGAELTTTLRDAPAQRANAIEARHLS